MVRPLLTGNGPGRLSESIEVGRNERRFAGTERRTEIRSRTHEITGHGMQDAPVRQGGRLRNLLAPELVM